jgi:hypothetical protein
MEEMLDNVRHELLTVDSENLGQPTDYEDPATPEVEKLFELLKAAEEPLHEHTKVTVLVFVTRLMAIKSKFAFSNNCYKELLHLISDVLPENHKMPKDMYQSKKSLSGSVWTTKKSMFVIIIVCFSGRRPRVRRSVLYVVSVDSLSLKTTMV